MDKNQLRMKRLMENKEKGKLLIETLLMNLETSNSEM